MRSASGGPSSIGKIPQPDPDRIEEDARRALAEDVGSGDVTAALIPESIRARGTVVCREAAILCGAAWFDAVYAQLDRRVTVTWSSQDGTALGPEETVCVVEGPARALLTGERSALNFLQLLSGTATFASLCARAVAGTRTKILDTRKTLPGLRVAQKYAVRCGGCDNHRMGLFDAILIKENHIAAAGSIDAAVRAGRRAQAALTLEVEVETLDQLGEALSAGADIVMLDNFAPADISEAVSRAAGRAKLEVSGNVTPEEIRRLADYGVDFISLGALTKDVHAIDFSMRFEPAPGT